jgi:Peptidase propeptide and YPEB domain
MKKNPILIASIALTVFVLAFGSILIVSAARGKDEIPTADNSQKQISVEEYAALVEEANQRILLASQGQASAANEATTQSAAGSDNSQPLANITPETALELALSVALDPQTVKGSPELVSFEGQPAYEIKFGEGAIYVSAATGEILMNGTTSLAPGNVTLEQAVRIAQDYMDLESIYQADVVSFQGAEIYRVIFNAGHFVYVDKDGQIIYVQIYSPSSNDQPPAASSSGDDGGHDDDHDDHDDDDYDDD